jgi:hypothetical protein
MFPEKVLTFCSRTARVDWDASVEGHNPRSTEEEFSKPKSTGRFLAGNSVNPSPAIAPPW